MAEEARDVERVRYTWGRTGLGDVMSGNGLKFRGDYCLGIF